jgi:hypothetical protein
VYGYEEWSGYVVEVDINGVNDGNGENLILLLLLENIPPFWNLEIILQENMGYLIHLSFPFLFLGRHRSTHCFKYLRHLSIFSILLFF